MATFAQFFLQFEKRLDHDHIDVFLEHLNSSVSSRLKQLDEEYKKVVPADFEDEGYLEGYKMHLSDLGDSSAGAKALADELSIIALQKQVETHSGRMIMKYTAGAKGENLSDFNKVKKLLLPIDVEKLDGYPAVHELRLINNAIKHQNSKVSPQLANAFPSWKLHDELADLDKSYQRLLPGVKIYIEDLVINLHAKATAIP